MNRAAALTKRETQIMRRRGSRTNSWWRMIRARKLRNEGLTLQKIAEIMDCTHSTIIYYLQMYEANMKYDKEFQEMVRMYEDEPTLSIHGVIVSAQKVVDVCRKELGTGGEFCNIMRQLGIKI